MAITLIGASTSVTNPTLPTNTANGDRVFVFAYRSGSAVAPTLPADWTLVTSRAVAPALLVSYRDKDATWSAMPTQFLNATRAVAITLRPTSGKMWSAPIATLGGATSTTMTFPAGTILTGAACAIHGSVNTRPDVVIPTPSGDTLVDATGTNPGYGTYLKAGATVSNAVNVTVSRSSTYSTVTLIQEEDTPPYAQQDAYRFFADGTETGSTAIANINTDPTIDVSSGDVNFNLRYRIAEYNGRSTAATDDWTVQWQKNSSGTWSDLTGPVIVTDSYEGSADTTVGPTVAGSGYGQSFKGSGGKLSKVEFHMKKVGTPAGSATGYINGHTGSYGSTGTGTSTTLATGSTRAGTSFSTTAGWEAFTFDETYTLTAGTPYCCTFRIDATNTASNGLQVSVDTTSPTHAGAGQFVDAASAFTANSAQDRLFRVYEKLPQVAVPYASPNLTDGGATTNRLGSSNFIAGKVSEDGTVDNLSLPSGASIELLYSITLKSADLSNGDYIWFRVVRNGAPLDWYLWAPTVFITKTLPVVSQAAYRFYGSGTETASAALAAQDTAPTIDVLSAATAQLRVRLQETSGGYLSATDDWRLQVERNASGTWDDINPITQPVYGTGAGLTDNAATTNRLGAGSGSFVAGKIGTSGIVSDTGWSGNNYTELVYGLGISPAGSTHGDTLRFRVRRNGVVLDSYAATPTVFITKTLPVVTQAAYRWYDEGTESGAVPYAAQDTTVIGDITNGDATGTLRIRLQETNGGTVPATDDWQLQYEKNTSGTWVNVSAVSTAAQTYDSPNLTNGAATTNRLTGGTGTFTPGKVSEDALMDDLGLPANTHTELVYALKIKAADLAAGDTLSFRVLRNSAVIDNYAVTPRIDLIKSVTAVTQAAYRFYEDGTETGAAPLVAQDTTPTVDTSAGDVNLGLRVRLQETGTVAVPATDDFQLQWEKNTSGTWTDVVAPELLADGYDESNSVGSATIGTTTRIGQSFTGDGRKLTRAGFHGRNTGGTTVGSLVAELYAHAGTFGTSSVPTGSALDTSTAPVDVTTLTATPAWIDFQFGGTVTLTAGTKYVITVSPQSFNFSGVELSRDNTSPTHPGNRSFSTGTWTAEPTIDEIFRVYTGPATPSTTVIPYDSPNLTGTAATTSRLTGGAGSFAAGEVSEDGTVNDLGWAASGHTELLYSLTLKQADLAPTDTLKFRVLRNGALLNSYAAVPTVTIGTAGPVTRQATVAMSASSTLTTTGTVITPPVITGTVAMSATSTLTTTGTVTAGALSVTAIPQDFTNPDWVMNGGSATPTRLTFAGSLRSAATATSYTLANSRVFWKVGQTATHITSGVLYVDADNYVRLGTNGTSITVQTILDANYVTDFTVTDNPAKRFFSIRESGGTITFERSATGQEGTWETLTTGAAPAFAISGAPFRFESTSGVGTSWIESLNQAQAPVVTATVDLTASSTLTTTGTAFHVLAGGVDLTASSTLTATAVRAAVPTVAMVATSTLATTAVREAVPTVSMSATSTLATTALRTAVPTVASVVTSTLTTTATRAALPTVGMSATSTLSITATREAVPTVGMTATSTLSTTAVREAVPTVSMSATSTLSATGTTTGAQIVSIAADLVTVSSLLTTAEPIRLPAVPMAAISTLITTGTAFHVLTASVTLDATSSLTTVAIPVRPAAVPMAATSTLITTGIAFHVLPAIVPMAATSTLSVEAIPTRFAVVSMTATSTLVTTPVREAVPTVAMSATSTLVTTGVREVVPAVVISTVSTLTATAIITVLPTVAMSTVSTLTSAGTVIGVGLAVVAMTATSTLAVASVREQLPTVSLSTVSTLAVTSVRTVPADAALVVISTLSTTGIRVVVPAVAMSVTSTLAVAAVPSRVSTVIMTAASTLVVTGDRTVFATVTMTVASILTTGAVKVKVAGVTLTATAVLTAGPTRLTFAAVALATLSTLTAEATRLGTGVETVTGSDLYIKLPTMWAPVGRVMKSP